MNVPTSYDDSSIPTLSYTGTSTGSSEEKRPLTPSALSYIDWSNQPLASSALLQTRKWTTLIVSSVLAGYLAASIDLVSVSLNDLKKGLCFSKMDRWSLLNPYLTCPHDDWYTWSHVFFGATGLVLNILVNFPIYTVLALVMAIIATYITVVRAPRIKHSGIPEIKLIISGFNYHLDEYLGFTTLVYKVCGLVLVVSLGVWLGKEGPLVHVSCCLLNVVYSFIVRDLGTEAVQRELLSAATATGISVAFNAPIGGVLFVLEMMPTFFMPTKIMWNSFVTATVALVVMSGFKLFTEGTDFYEQDLFQVHFGNFSWLFMETVPFVILGMLGGLYGHLLTSLHMRFTSGRARLHARWGPKAPYWEVAAVIVATCLLNFPLEMAKLPLNAYLKLLFTECTEDSTLPSTSFLCSKLNWLTLVQLAYILVQGFLLLAYTFSMDLPGGILMPSLVLGASAGRLMGIISQAIQNAFKWELLATCTATLCIVLPSSYAVVGAALFMTGITKLTMAVVVIIFELTGAVTYVLPIMLSVMILKLFNDWLRNDNVYDLWMRRFFNRPTQSSHSDFFDSRASLPNANKGSGLVDFSTMTATNKNCLPDVTVSAIMAPTAHTKCLVLDGDYSVSELVAFMSEDPHEGYPAIKSFSDPVVMGFVYKQELFEKVSAYEESTVRVKILSNDPEIHSDESTIHKDALPLHVYCEQLHIVINDQMPIVSVLCMFEQLHMNYAIVVQSGDSRLMAGFVDRFMVSDSVDLGFVGLHRERDLFEIEEDEYLELAGLIT